MRKPLTAPPLTAAARLVLLLPWLNGEPLPATDVRRRLRAFLDSFDGSASAGHLRVFAGSARRGVHEIDDSSPEALDAIRERLVDLLRRGFAPNLSVKDGKWATDQQWGEAYPNMRPYPSLSFGVMRRLPRPAVKRSRASADERRAYIAPGAYILLVDGELSDLVSFFVAHLLTATGMVAVSRCPAPAPRDWEARCNRFVLSSGVGRPKVFCTDTCRVRNNAEKERREAEEEVLVKEEVLRRQQRRAMRRKR